MKFVQVDWEDAKALCKSVGLVMSVVENKAESDALSAISLERAMASKGKAYLTYMHD